MASWQPPIPAGALYSKPARAIGPAIALLAYCYDLVQRDGWLELSLKDAASDMEESYQNIKRWWWLLKDGPFFAATEDHGRKGWKARFKDVWIDWRILNSRPSTDDQFSRSNEGTELDLDDTQGQLKVNSRSNEGTEKNLDAFGNKVLMTTDQARSVRSLSANGTHPTSQPKSRDPTPEQKALNERKKAIEQAYVTELGYTPAAFGKEAKSAKWLAEQGYTPEQIIKCYQHLQQDDFYARQHISLAIISKQIGATLKHKGSNNGTTHRQHNGGRPQQGLEMSPSVPKDNDKPW